mgnify:CR=1 FL=1
MTTIAVGLFEAKTHLSEYVARAEKGEEDEEDDQRRSASDHVTLPGRGIAARRSGNHAKLPAP